ncbi:MAG: GuaB3 family IMP dehydrogenase-related protein [Dehalococcoidia bacterium]
MSQPQFKQMRRAYGFDDVAIVPGGHHTINPDLVELSFKLGRFDFPLPFVAAAMDGVVDVRMAVEFSKLGGLAVLNLEGVQTRYDDPAPILQEIAAAPRHDVTALMQKVYSAPIKPELIGERVRQIKAQGGIAAVSSTPMNTKKFAPVARDAGVDVFVVQSTVTSARHISRSETGLIFDELVRNMREVPVVVGNTVTFSATKELMETGVAAVLIGVGPGAACTSREVLGIGVPQVTATIDAAAARDTYYRESGRYVPIITDGGISNGGAMCKAFAAGADAVMLGSILAATEEAPGRGHHWGMATPHGELPRGTRVKVAIDTTVHQTLFGPTSRTDGRENLVGALRTAMGTCGARTIRDFQKTELVIAPSIKTEGKNYQMAQGE